MRGENAKGMTAVEETRALAMKATRGQEEVQTVVCCPMIPGMQVDSIWYSQDVKQYLGAELVGKREERERLLLQTCIQRYCS